MYATPACKVKGSLKERLCQSPVKFVHGDCLVTVGAGSPFVYYVRPTLRPLIYTSAPDGTDSIVIFTVSLLSISESTLLANSSLSSNSIC